MSVIFGKVTPKEVINTGPYALVRHPVYVSYMLGWLGSLIAMQQEWRHNHAFFGFVRMVGMAVVVMGLIGLYREGADLEERQFMLNEDVVRVRLLSWGLGGNMRVTRVWSERGGSLVLFEERRGTKE